MMIYWICHITSHPHGPHMSMSNRATQFSPFTALTGYDNEIMETARLTDEKIELHLLCIRHEEGRRSLCN